MTPLRITTIQFNDGTAVPVPADAIVVLVGPNSSGKSRALREINQQIVGSPEPSLVVTAIEVEKRMDEDGLKNWLKDHAHVYRAGQEERVVRPGSGEVSFSVTTNWQAGPPFNNLGSFLVMLASAESRLGLVGSAGAMDLLTQHPSAPLQELYVDEALEKQLSDAVQRAFATPVTVNRVAGGQIHLHMGRPEESGLPVPTNKAYRDALQALPLAQNEDGWARGKRGGLSVLPQGEASEAGVRLLEALQAMGVHVVAVGELERWAPAVGGHGPAWVAAALEARVHEATGPHVDFVQQLLAD